MRESASRAAILSGLFWKMMERGGSQGVQFIVQIILARLLLPEDYGTLAIVTVFTLVANVFVQSGFHSAIIQRQDTDDVDYSSVFIFSLTVAGVLYVGLFAAAPWISNFFNDPLLVPVLRVITLTLFLGALRSVQSAIIARRMEFKKFFYGTVGATVVSGAAGIVAAYAGWGVWALVLQQLVSGVMLSIILWFLIDWRPRLLFSWPRLQMLLAFGWKLLASSLLNTLYMELRTLFIGKLYTPETLGYFNRGRQFPQLLVGNIDGSIQAVMFPALSSYQHDPERMRSLMRRAIVTSSFLVFPLMAGLAVTAQPLVLVLLTDRWLPAVPFLQIFCASYALQPIHTANLQAINALGRSEIFLKLEVVKKILGIGILLISLPYGVYAIAWGGLVSAMLSSVINAFPNRKLLAYRFEDQIRDIFPSLALALIMGGVVWILSFLPWPPLYTLMLQIVTGAAVYIGLAALLRLECFYYVLQLVKTRGRDPQPLPKEPGI